MADLFKDSNLDSIYRILAENSLTQDKTLIDYVKEKYEELGLSQSQFSKVIGVEKQSWQRIENGKAQKIDISILIKISQFLNVDIKELIQLYIASANVEEIHDLEKSRRFSYIANNFDLKVLRSTNFIETTTDFESIENRIKEYFNLQSIYEYSTVQVPIAFSKSKLSQSNKMLNFWTNIVYEQTKKINNPFDYDEEKLLSILPKMRLGTLDVEYGFAQFKKALYGCGVTVIVESYFAKTAIRGGTFIINQKPFVVLTNFRNTYPSLWWTLAHELYHVINDFKEISKTGYHLSETDTLFTDEFNESLANNFADRIFLSNENYEMIKTYIELESVVKKYAAQWNVHPSLIYSIYLSRNKSDYVKFSKYLINANSTIKNIQIIDPWTAPTLQSTAEIINQQLTKQVEQEQLN